MRTETIVAAAVLHLGKVYSVPPPGRHHDAIRVAFEANPAGGAVRGGRAQGFVTSTGRYVTRELAGEIALTAGQASTLEHGPRLFSEDLW